MKNLLIYTHPRKRFYGENESLIKIHIDNSLELGWSRENILLYTNFPYEYNGVQSQIVPNRLIVEWDMTSNKIFVIRYLLNKKLLKGMYWYHDLDAYQNEVITEEEIEMGDCDLAITGYGYKPQANGGSFFFRETSGDIFQMWCEKTLEITRTRADEKTLTDMINDGTLKRYKWLNLTYNFGQRVPELCYRKASQPLKVLHFHPYYKYYPKESTNIEVFMHGKNRYNIPMMSDRLIKLFKKYGIK